MPLSGPVPVGSTANECAVTSMTLPEAKELHLALGKFFADKAVGTR